MTIVPHIGVIPETNVPDDAVPFWSAYETYDKGIVVQYDGVLYECLAASSTGEVPADNPVVWYMVSPTNKMAMFDAFNATVTQSTSDIVVVYDGVDDVTDIGLFGLIGESVSVTVESKISGEVLNNDMYTLSLDDVSDWWEFNYKRTSYKKRLHIKTKIAFNQKITITIHTVNGMAACGNIVLGTSQYTGCTLYGATVSVRSMANRDRRSDGRVYLSKGNGYDRVSVPVIINQQEVDDTVNKFREIDGVPTLFVGDDRDVGIESLMVFGFFRDFDIAISASKNKYTIDIEGVG